MDSYFFHYIYNYAISVEHCMSALKEKYKKENVEKNDKMSKKFELLKKKLT